MGKREVANKDLAQLAKVVRKLGGSVERTRGGHLRWLDADGRLIATSPSTPSDHRAVRNLRADLRRGGMEV